MNKAQMFLKNNSSTILTVIGAGGVVATTVLAVKATPKALILLQNAEYEKGDKLTPLEVVKTAWKPYIPAVIAGASTMACIFGANHLSTKRQASLMSAYALLDSSYKEYKNKVKELYGEDADNNVKRVIAKDTYDDDIVIGENKLLFFDYQSHQFFESTMEHVLETETKFQQMFMNEGWLTLNDYYKLLGIPTIEYGDDVGWNTAESVYFNYDETEMTNGETCWILTIMPDPTWW